MERVAGVTDSLRQALADLPPLLAWHVLLSLCAIATAAALALTLALAADRSERTKHFSLAAAGVVQTIPGLALLALMVPLLGGSIGFLPAYFALTLYAVLPMLQNAVAGLTQIDAPLIEAARGIGMTERQILVRVRFPLAFPVIVAGLRTSTVWTVGMTTLATAVGASGLGTYIFTGLQTRNHVMTLFGCFFAAALALALDQALRVLEHAIQSRRHGLARSVTAALAAMGVLAAVGALAPAYLRPVVHFAEQDAPAVAEATANELPLAGQRFVTASKSFVESHVLAEVLGLQLRQAGATVVNRPSMGSTILFSALAANEVDCYVDYSGTIWANYMKRDAPRPRLETQVLAAAYLLEEHGIVSVGPLGFLNNYTIAVRRDRAAQLGLREMSDLAKYSLTVGGDPELFGRPEWARVTKLYGLDAVATRSMQAIYMLDAVRNGQVDAVAAYTTDGKLAGGDLVFLADPRAAFPPYDAMLLISPDVSRNPAFVATLAKLVNRISEEQMRLANLSVESGELTLQAAGRKLWESIL